VAAIVGDASAFVAGSVVGAAAMACLGVLLVGASARWRTAWWGIALLAFAVAHLRADLVYRPYFATHDVAALELPTQVRIDAEVERDPERRANGVRLTLAVRALGRGERARAASGRILLHLRNAQHEWARGDRLSGFVRLRRPRNFGNPGEFDYEAHLARRGVHVTAFAFDDARLVRTPGPAPGALTRWRVGVAQLFAAQASEREAALLRALILGMSGELPSELRESFARTGVSHILAISGLHVGLVAVVAYASLRWLLARSEWLLLRFVVPKLAAALSLVPVLLYAGIAGSNVATGRAVAMAVLVLGAVLSDRQSSLAVALALAAAGIVAAKPGVSAEVSFQLTFVAVAGLLAATDRFRRWWPGWEDETLLRLRPRRARVLWGVAGYLVVATAAFLATTPLVAYHFNRISLAAPLANLVVTPILGTLLVPLGLLAALAQPLSPGLAALVIWLATPVAMAGIWLVEAIAAVPFASVRVVTPSLALLACLYAAFLAAAFAQGRARAVGVGGGLGIVLLLGLGGAIERRTGDELRVTFLSVGQGDSAVVELPGGAVMVIDGGGLGGQGFDVGERLIAPYLWSRGISQVDVLVVTHPQWDHYGGLAFIAEEFAPREVWTNGQRPTAAGWRRLEDAVDRVGARWQTVARGFERPWAGVAIRAHGPPAAHGWGVNDGSIVLSLTYAGRQFLLTGDIEEVGEAALVAATRAGTGIRSTVIKVPHHGSVTSSTPSLIAAVAPEFAVVSVGRDNRFRFPHRDVVRRYRGHRARLLRTDRDGAVVVVVVADGGIDVDGRRTPSNGIDSM